MIILATTNDKLKINLGGAHTTNPVRLFASFRDFTSSVFTPGRNGSDSNGTTDVDIVGSPAASTYRIIDYVSAHNSDTVNQTVNVKFHDGTNPFILFSVVLAPGEKLEYQEGKGFQVFASNGSVKSTYQSGNNPSSSVINTVVLGTDQVNNNATANTIADVTGLSFAVTSGKTYWFRFVVDYTAPATTTGSRWSINGPASPTRLSFSSRYSLTATTETNNQGLSAYDTPAGASATSAAGAANMAIVEGFITPSANGTVILRFASEISSSAITAKAGSYLQWQEVL